MAQPTTNYHQSSMVWSCVVWSKSDLFGTHFTPWHLNFHAFASFKTFFDFRYCFSQTGLAPSKSLQSKLKPTPEDAWSLSLGWHGRTLMETNAIVIGPRSNFQNGDVSGFLIVWARLALSFSISSSQTIQSRLNWFGSLCWQCLKKHLVAIVSNHANHAIIHHPSKLSICQTTPAVRRKAQLASCWVVWKASGCSSHHRDPNGNPFARECYKA